MTDSREGFKGAPVGRCISVGTLLLVAVGLLWFLGSGCDRDELDEFYDDLSDSLNTIRTSNHAGTVDGKPAEISPMVQGTTTEALGGTAASVTQVRALWVPAGTVGAGSPVTVTWHPPSGAGAFSFSRAPENTQGPPPFLFSGIAVQVAGAGAPALEVGYSRAGSASDTLVDTFVVETAGGSTYSAHFTATAGQSQATSGAFPVQPAREPAPEAFPNQWFRSEMWYYNWSVPLDQELCQSFVEAIQHPSAFIAASFPVAATGGTAAAFPGPLVARSDTPAYPKFSLVRYNPFQVLLQMPMRFAPERLEFAENHLAADEDRRWTAITAAGPPVACPAGIDIAPGDWEFYSAVALDLGDDGCPGCQVRAYACFDSGVPQSVLAVAAAMRPGGSLISASAEGILCVGPMLIQAQGGTAPSIRVSGPNFALVNPPQRVVFRHSVERSGMSLSDLTVAVSSTGGATEWGVFHDAAGTQPVTGPVELFGIRSFWVIGDVPEGASGTDIVTLSASAPSLGEPVARNDSFAVIGTPDLPAAQDREYWLQVASHAPGDFGSQWRTDLGLLNPGASPVTADLRFHAAGGVLTRQQTVAAGQQLNLTDVVAGFGVNGSAALQVVSGAPLKVSSRTYTAISAAASCAPGGTFGQNYDAHTPDQGLGPGESAWLTQLTENAAYRTNIALTNMGSAPAVVAVTLFDGAGGEIGAYTVNLTPGQRRQENKPFFSKAGQTTMARGYARVTVTSGSGILASASVVDNITNDPTTMPMLPVAGAAAFTSWVQVASRASGAYGSQWRTDLGILNPGAQAAVVQVRFHKSGGVVQNSVNVAAGQQAILVDVVGQIPSTGSAGLEVVSSQPVVVSSRTYNQVAAGVECFPGGTLGQNYDAFTAARALQQGQVAHLTQLQENAAYRTNIALTNAGAVAAQVAVVLYDGNGTQLGQYTVALAPGERKQEDRPFYTKGGQSSLAAGYARVTVVQGSGIIASASVVDNTTNDPTTMPALR